MSISKQSGRRNARAKALQALYQWDLNTSAGNEPVASAIAVQFGESQDLRRVDVDYFQELLEAATSRTAELDRHLVEGLDRNVDELDPIERSVCRLAVYELLERMDVPLKVVINEWVEITKKYGADQGHKFVNGVLDKVGRAIRVVESDALKKEG